MAFSEHHLAAAYPFQSGRPVLVDVGAHQGSASKLFAAKGWKVVAFEPEPENRAAFEKNLAPYPDVVCIAKAVWDKSGARLPFFVSDQHYGIHSLRPFHASHRPSGEVETVRLADALEELGVEEVTVLKIDVEGADLFALKGFDFDRFRPEFAAVEFMDERSVPHFGYTHHDVVSLMEGKGYAAFVSEWAPIQEYGRQGVITPPHVWLGCSAYPLDHAPAWGNLLFVPKGRDDTFRLTLAGYLSRLRSETRRQAALSRVPGAARAVRVLSRLYRACLPGPRD